MKKERNSAPPPESAVRPPRRYIGPMPPPLISNLPCGCSHRADELQRGEQDFLIETVPDSEAWFEEVEA